MSHDSWQESKRKQTRENESACNHQTNYLKVLTNYEICVYLFDA